MNVHASKRLSVVHNPGTRPLQFLFLTVAMVTGALPALAADPATGPSTPRIVWRTSIGQSADTPAAADAGRTIVASGENLVVLSSADGKVLARIRGGPPLSSQPLLTKGGEFVAGHEDGSIAAHFDDALYQWTFKTSGRIVGRPAVVGDKVIAGSYDTNVYCLTVAEGKELWHFKTGAQVHAAPLIAGDMVIVGGCDGQLRALDIATGKERWSFDAGGPIATSPVLQNDRITFATMSGSIFCLDTAGNAVWQISPLKEQSPFTVSPAVSADRLAFASEDGQLVIVSPADGKLIARGTFPGKPSALLLRDGQLLAGVDDGRIHMMNAATGEQVGRITLGANPLAIIPVEQGIITNTADGNVWLLR